MSKISSGIKNLDNLIDLAHIGDNVVWETEAGTSEDIFIQKFIDQSLLEDKDIIYVSFNRSPQSILLHAKIKEHPEKLTILDCFTSGKGKSDRAFLKFYENNKQSAPHVIKVNRPGDISFFSETVNSIQDKLPEGARYIFDSLTGMQDLWGDENSTYKFFTYMCPRLYDLGTVAYWILEKDAHSQPFKANLRHITQVVIELYKKKDKLFLKALKLDGRTNREAFKPHSYEIEDNNIFIVPAKKEPAFNIGGQIKNARIRLGMSQKDLADKIGLTSSFISQIENNQISPSLNSFLQIAEALGISPTDLLQKEKKRDGVDWLFKKDHTLQSLLKKEDGYSLFNIVSNDKTSAYLTVINAGAELDSHFLNSKKNELIHVLKGTVSVKIENSEKMLSPGDSIYLKHSLPSVWKNASDEETELLVICI
ncbi:MAG: helix-turn-helix domain-containing protein [Thermodesulfovibrionales bacterium]|nr:helix-turn-helix domain-containing protein [Thermodesulfovibrionales bacterium]